MATGTPSDPLGTRRRVLVVGTDDWAIDQAAASLLVAGHEVARCHDSGSQAFPCNAFRPGRSCPVDQGVDVVADVRARYVGQVTAGEIGAVCGMRADVPLVVAGLAGDTPFGAMATATVAPGGDLASACEGAAVLDLRRGDLRARDLAGDLTAS